MTDRKWTQKIHHKNRIKDDRKKIEFTDLICAKYGKHLSQPGCLHSFVIGEYKTTHTQYFFFGNCKEIIRSNIKIGLRYIIIIHAPKNKRIICSKTKQSLLRVCLRSCLKQRIQSASNKEILKHENPYKSTRFTKITYNFRRRLCRWFLTSPKTPIAYSISIYLHLVLLRFP